MGLRTLIHEHLHATSPQSLSARYSYDYSEPGPKFLEEGLVEWRARNAITRTFAVAFEGAAYNKEAPRDQLPSRRGRRGRGRNAQLVLALRAKSLDGRRSLEAGVG